MARAAEPTSEELLAKRKASLEAELDYLNAASRYVASKKNRNSKEYKDSKAAMRAARAKFREVQFSEAGPGDANPKAGGK